MHNVVLKKACSADPQCPSCFGDLLDLHMNVCVCVELALILWDLCVGEVGAIGYLRGDAGAPAHALLTVPP